MLGGGVRMFTPSHPLTGHSASNARRAQALESPKPVPVTMMVVCDADGTIVWFRSEEVVVTEVDGVSPAAILTRGGVYR